MSQNLDITKVCESEDVRQKPYYGLDSYLHEVRWTRDLLIGHAQRVMDWRDDTDARGHFNSKFVELMAEITERGEDTEDVPKPRADALRRFYEKSIGKFDDPKDRIIFIQGIAAIDGGEFLDLLDMYHDDFNAALIEYKEMTEDDERIRH